MATKATVYKAQLNVADLDRGHYGDYALTLACHPSETEERLMLRLLAYALYAGERLEFCRGISNDDEPDLWEKDLTGDIQLWIELGQPDESRIRKACNRSRQVVILSFGARSPEPWWDKIHAALERFDNLAVLRIPAEASAALAAMADRSMTMQATIQDGVAFVSVGSGKDEASVEVAPVVLRSPAG